MKQMAKLKTMRKRDPQSLKKIEDEVKKLWNGERLQKIAEEEAMILEAKKKAQENIVRDVFKGGRPIMQRSAKEVVEQKKQTIEVNPDDVARLKFLGNLEEMDQKMKENQKN